MELLIAHGADPTVKASNDVNCIYIAAQNGFPTTVQSQIALGKGFIFVGLRYPQIWKKSKYNATLCAIMTSLLSAANRRYSENTVKPVIRDP